MLLFGSPSPMLDSYDIWSAVLKGSASPRTELLHEIDPLAYPRYNCSGPGNGVNKTWDLPPRAGFTRAALTAVINGTQWKLRLGDCAGWDTNSSNVPPPGYGPDPTKPTDRAALASRRLWLRLVTALTLFSRGKDSERHVGRLTRASSSVHNQQAGRGCAEHLSGSWLPAQPEKKW